MNRLQFELDRLYLVQTPAGLEAGAQPSALVGPSGQVRAMVMELAQAPNWDVLARVWRGVQSEFGLPAPAVAVSGSDGLQLWFSLAEPIEAVRAHAFLEGLRLHFLADIASSRVRLMPASNTAMPHQERHARIVPACQEQTGYWSAFLAPDLVPLFADSPWLDVAPGEDGQAALLARVEMMKQPLFEAVSDKLAPKAPSSPAGVAVAASGSGAIAASRPASGSNSTSPQQFLLQVMHDDSAPLALRIEAAKALLRHASDLRPPRSD